jgi:hypothetical protein
VKSTSVIARQPGPMPLIKAAGSAPNRVMTDRANREQISFMAAAYADDRALTSPNRMPESDMDRRAFLMGVGDLITTDVTGRPFNILEKGRPLTELF